MTTYRCPICDSRDLRAINGRAHALCGGCGAYERTRLMWLVLEGLIPRQNSWDVLHFAPERGLSSRLHQAAGGSYRAFDFDPSGFALPHAVVGQIDLCRDARRFPRESVDLIVHSHVLEHLPCSVFPVVAALNDALRPGGFHVFSIPVIGQYYACDLDPQLPPAERSARYGQPDHMRRFGHGDARSIFADMFGRDVHYSRTIAVERNSLAMAGIPESVMTTVNSHCVLVWRKADVLTSAEGGR